MASEIKCPNCGNPRLLLIATETTEKTYFLSTDGRWLSVPVFDADSKAAFQHVPKVLSSKMTLFCHCCGQENEAVLTVKDRLSTRLSIGTEINHGAPFKKDKKTGNVIFD